MEGAAVTDASAHAGRRARALLSGAALAMSAAVATPRPCRAVLYNTSAGYQYTAGSGAYWGQDVWAYGSLRLKGGWYPFGQAAGFNDERFRWGFAPGAGLQKGLPGLGRPRVSYAYYTGELRLQDLRGAAHAVELGWFRAMTPRLAGDLSYRYLDGDLFGGANGVYDVPGGLADYTLRPAVYHEGRLALIGSQPLGAKTLRVEFGLSASTRVDAGTSTAQSVALDWPVLGPLFLRGSLTVAQNGAGPGRTWVATGLSYGRSGRFGGP